MSDTDRTSSPDLARFLRIYHLGIWLALSLVAGFYLQWQSVKPGYTLALGLGHMLLLVVLGSRLPVEDKARAGGRIQTAGYLHTLLGFSAALIIIGSNGAAPVSFDDILAPLGSALITSVLGWFMGSDIHEEGRAHEPSVADGTERIAGELEAFAEKVTAIHEKYAGAVSGLSHAYLDLAGAFSTLTETARELSGALQPSLGAAKDLSGTLRETASAAEHCRATLTEVGKESERLGGAIEQAGAAARDTAKYLETSRVLITELEALVGVVTAHLEAA